MKVRFDDTTHFTSDLVGGARDANANAVKLTGAETGSAPIVGAVGDDTNIAIQIAPKGTGVLGLPRNTARAATVSTITTAAAVTFTAAQILGGLILRDPSGGARADLMPTASDLVAILGGVDDTMSVEFTIRNTADADETITLTTNTGITLSGTMTIAQNNSKRFLAVVTAIGTPAVTVYSLGTVVH
jgi:hypothetical protein